MISNSFVELILTRTHLNLLYSYVLVNALIKTAHLNITNYDNKKVKLTQNSIDKIKNYITKT